MNRFLRGVSLYLLIAILAVATITALFRPPTDAPRNVDFGEFLDLVEAGEVKSARFLNDYELSGTLADGSKIIVVIPRDTVNLSLELREAGVHVAADPQTQPPWWITFLPHIITLVIFIGIWLFIMNQM